MTIKPTVDLSHAFNASLTAMFEPTSDRMNQLSRKRIKDKFGDTSRSRPDGKTIAYDCIHLSPNEFCRQMVTALQFAEHTVKHHDDYTGNNPIRFLDVGCGVGQKVYMAAALFECEAFGLELREEHVMAARRLLRQYLAPCERNYSSNQKFKSSNIFQANALTYDKFSQYDLIYFYCPSCDTETEVALEKQIAKTARVGCVVNGALSKYFTFLGRDRAGYRSRVESENDIENELKALGWIRITDGIWKRVSAGSVA